MTDVPLSQYVTNEDSQVFALRNLPEEVVAVLFAYYSRSTGGLRENLARLLQEGDVAAVPSTVSEVELAEAQAKAREFHEKWVVGYGHSSVAEHAVLHLAVEDVSILASKVIEDARLASFTEKSTRYVVFDENRFYTPPVLQDSAVYTDTCRFLMGTYARLMPDVIERIKQERPRREGQSARGWETACKAAACDILRYLLPASTRTNIGITANARTLEHLLTKMLSSPLEECRELGAAMKREASVIAPTLIKYAEPNAYMRSLPAFLGERCPAVYPSSLTAEQPEVRLISGPAEPEIDLTAALLYEYDGEDWTSVRAKAAEMAPDERKDLIRTALATMEQGGMRGAHDQPPRALEHLSFTYEILLDYGAYRDIQRHRMLTLTHQRLNTRWGYCRPAEFQSLGLEDVFKECMERSATAYEALAAKHPHEAQYVLPLAWRIRLLFTWNLRELHHFISLRSGKQGHAAYRKVAQDVWKALAQRDPLLAEYIRVDMKDYNLARA